MMVAGLLLVAAKSQFSQNTSGGPGAQEIVQYLNQTIGWYHQINEQRQLAIDPNDILIMNDNGRIADEVVRLAFDFARAQVENSSKQNGSTAANNQAEVSARYQSLAQMSSQLDKQIQDTQAELQGFKQKLPTVSGQKLLDLRALMSETQSELDLANARKEAVQSMLQFVGGSGTSGLGAAGASGEIEALAHSLPAALTRPTPAGKTAASTPEAFTPIQVTAANNPPPTGIWGLTAEVFSLSRKSHQLDACAQSTKGLAQKSDQLRTPLIALLRELSNRSETIAKAADSADPNTLAQEKKDLDALTGQFKQVSAAVLPLSKQGILLDLCARNLSDWQAGLQGRFKSALRNLLARLAFLVILLVAVIGGAELWRRTILRYVHEARHRYQLLLLRKIVMWFVVGLIIAFSFASQIGSVATFAGLLTAGVAVALQNVILSIAGYFFLIGKFGIRVGDRVQIAGVTGEVIHIGLVRIHIMELSTGANNVPSGRVVAFSNSIVFQPTSGLFKQIPGTNFIWHEITLTLAADNNYQTVEGRLQKAVEAALVNYRDVMEQQRLQLERTLRYTPVDTLRPKTRLRFTPGGLEATIRFPVELRRAAEIDDQVTRELLRAIDEEPKLKLIGAGTLGLTLNTDLSMAS